MDAAEKRRLLEEGQRNYGGDQPATGDQPAGNAAQPAANAAQPGGKLSAADKERIITQGGQQLGITDVTTPQTIATAKATEGFPTAPTGPAQPSKPPADNNEGVFRMGPYQLGSIQVGPYQLDYPSHPLDDALSYPGRLWNRIVNSSPTGYIADIGRAAQEGFHNTWAFSPELSTAAQGNFLTRTLVNAANADLGALGGLGAGTQAAIAGFGNLLSPGLGNDLATMYELLPAGELTRLGRVPRLREVTDYYKDAPPPSAPEITPRPGMTDYAGMNRFDRMDNLKDRINESAADRQTNGVDSTDYHGTGTPASLAERQPNAENSTTYGAAFKRNPRALLDHQAVLDQERRDMANSLDTPAGQQDIHQLLERKALRDAGFDKLLNPNRPMTLSDVDDVLNNLHTSMQDLTDPANSVSNEAWHTLFNLRDSLARKETVLKPDGQLRAGQTTPDAIANLEAQSSRSKGWEWGTRAAATTATEVGLNTVLAPAIDALAGHYLGPAGPFARYALDLGVWKPIDRAVKSAFDASQKAKIEQAAKAWASQQTAGASAAGAPVTYPLGPRLNNRLLRQSATNANALQTTPDAPEPQISP